MGEVGVKPESLAHPRAAVLGPSDFDMLGLTGPGDGYIWDRRDLGRVEEFSQLLQLRGANVSLVLTPSFTCL